jgi:hypothetical protein
MSRVSLRLPSWHTCKLGIVTSDPWTLVFYLSGSATLEVENRMLISGFISDLFLNLLHNPLNASSVPTHSSSSSSSSSRSYA